MKNAYLPLEPSSNLWKSYGNLWLPRWMKWKTSGRLTDCYWKIVVSGWFIMICPWKMVIFSSSVNVYRKANLKKSCCHMVYSRKGGVHQCVLLGIANFSGEFLLADQVALATPTGSSIICQQKYPKHTNMLVYVMIYVNNTYIICMIIYNYIYIYIQYTIYHKFPKKNGFWIWNQIFDLPRRRLEGLHLHGHGPAQLLDDD